MKIYKLDDEYYFMTKGGNGCKCCIAAWKFDNSNSKQYTNIKLTDKFQKQLNKAFVFTYDGLPENFIRPNI